MIRIRKGMLKEHISQVLIHAAFQAVSGLFLLFLVEDKGDGLCYKSYTELQLSEEAGDCRALSNTGKGIVAQGDKKVIFNL